MHKVRLAELRTVADAPVIEKPHMWGCADKRDVLKLGTTYFTIKGESGKINSLDGTYLL